MRYLVLILQAQVSIAFFYDSSLDPVQYLLDTYIFESVRDTIALDAYGSGQQRLDGIKGLQNQISYHLVAYVLNFFAWRKEVKTIEKNGEHEHCPPRGSRNHNRSVRLHVSTPLVSSSASGRS